MRGDRDGEVLRLAITHGQWLALKYAPEPFKGDRETVLEAAAWEVASLQYAPACLRGNKSFMLEVVNFAMRALRLGSDACKREEERSLLKSTILWHVLTWATPQLRKDEAFVHGTQSACSEGLDFKVLGMPRSFLSAVCQHADVERPFVGLKAVRQKHAQRESALFFIDALRGDREVVLQAVAQNGLALQFAPQLLRGDREVLQAIDQNGLALQFATEDFRGDREVVLHAVQQNGLALQYATEALRGDRE
eukprot:6166165-Amphidinium_carterae.1